MKHWLKDHAAQWKCFHTYQDTQTKVTTIISHSNTSPSANKPSHYSLRATVQFDEYYYITYHNLLYSANDEVNNTDIDKMQIHPLHTISQIFQAGMQWIFHPVLFIYFVSLLKKTRSLSIWNNTANSGYPSEWWPIWRLCDPWSYMRGLTGCYNGSTNKGIIWNEQSSCTLKY